MQQHTQRLKRRLASHANQSVDNYTTAAAAAAMAAAAYSKKHCMKQAALS